MRGFSAASCGSAETIGSFSGAVVSSFFLLFLESTGLSDLVEVFQIAFEVHGEVVGEVEFSTENNMIGFLKVRFDGFAVVGFGQVVDARKEAIEKVHDIAVTRGGDEVLRIHAGGGLDAKPVGGVVFEGKTRFWRHAAFVYRSVPLQTETWFKYQLAKRGLVFEVCTDFSRIVFIVNLDVAVVAVGRVFRSVPQHFNTVFQGVFTKEIAEIEAHVETVDAAVARLIVSFFHRGFIAGIGEVTFHHDGRFSRNDEEIGTSSVGIPLEIGKRLVIVHLVVEGEAKEIDFAAVRRIERELSVNVLIVEGQTVFVGVFVKALAGLFQIGVLAEMTKVAAADSGVLAFTIGPSNMTFAPKQLAPTFPEMRFLLPSRVEMSMTDDILPPYSAPKPPV